MCTCIVCFFFPSDDMYVIINISLVLGDLNFLSFIYKLVEGPEKLIYLFIGYLLLHVIQTIHVHVHICYMYVHLYMYVLGLLQLHYHVSNVDDKDIQDL